MPGMTDWLESQVLNWTLRPGSQVDFTQPEAVYVGLFTTATGEYGGGVEVSGGSYARQQVTIGTNGKNTNTITFPTATSDWGTIVACAIFNASASGQMLYFGNLTTSRLVKTGDVFKFEADNLTVTID